MSQPTIGTGPRIESVARARTTHDAPTSPPKRSSSCTSGWIPILAATPACGRRVARHGGIPAGSTSVVSARCRSLDALLLEKGVGHPGGPCPLPTPAVRPPSRQRRRARFPIQSWAARRQRSAAGSYAAPTEIDSPVGRHTMSNSRPLHSPTSESHASGSGEGGASSTNRSSGRAWPHHRSAVERRQPDGTRQFTTPSQCS